MVRVAYVACVIIESSVQYQLLLKIVYHICRLQLIALVPGEWTAGVGIQGSPRIQGVYVLYLLIDPAMQSPYQPKFMKIDRMCVRDLMSHIENHNWLLGCYRNGKSTTRENGSIKKPKLHMHQAYERHSL
jgi:hypothetical protein